MALSVRRWSNVALLALTGMIGCPAFAEQPENITVGEIALLPEYCGFASGFGPGTPEHPSPGQAAWIDKLGPAFWSMHHYCWALINASRSARAGLPLATRDQLLVRAIGDINHVLRNSPPSFVLAPEIYLRRGEYLERLQQLSAALESFSLARKAKPDYWPAYLRAASLHERLGSRALALAVLDEGLSVTPGQQDLTTARNALNTRRAPAPRQARDATGTSGK